MSALPSWASKHYAGLSLDAAGLVALADLSTIARRTAFTGTSALADILILCPGLHKQLEAPKLNDGEYPACAAMTTGYAFRVENQAMVIFLQKVGLTGHLTCLNVAGAPLRPSGLWQTLSGLHNYRGAPMLPAFAYFLAAMLTPSVLVLMALLEDWWGFAVVCILMFARAINVLVIRRLSIPQWKGELEPGEQSDLIILVSQDRWIRMRGATDDVKVITSGTWLQDPTFLQSSLVGFATLLVYLDAALAGNATKEGKVLLIILLFCSVGLLALVNEHTKVFRMYGRTISVEGPPQPYNRRLTLTKKLMRESGRSDWAIRLGMAQPSDVEALQDEELSVKTATDNMHVAPKMMPTNEADEQVIL